MNVETSIKVQARPWVLVADRTRARLLTAAAPDGPLEDVNELVNADARLHEADLASDAHGHLAGGQRGSSARAHTAGTDDSIKEHHGEVFARHIGDELNRLRVAGNISRLYLVAEPGLLGSLRKHIDDSTRRLVQGEIDKMLTRHSSAEIRALLPKRL